MSCPWVHKFTIKPNRWIYVPTQDALDYGKLVKTSLEAKWKAPPFYYHLNVGGHVKLVQDAKAYRYFSKFDFENYFAQITRNRICRCLKRYFSYDEPKISDRMVVEADGQAQKALQIH